MPLSQVAFGIFDGCLKWLDRIRASRKLRDERTDQALFALYTALNETKSYIETLHSGKRRNRKKEYAIAKLWHHASVPLREINMDFADRCFSKGNYWMSPDVWTDAMIKKKRIKLDQVLKSIRNILLNK
jgi:hypothetical protein